MADGYDLDTGSLSFRACQRDYADRSEQASHLSGARLDIAYGDDPRQRMDIFPAGPSAPVLVFFRGGYWTAGSKDERRFPALEWLPRGVSWVAVNYRLAPAHALTEIVDDTRDSLNWISRHGVEMGLDPNQLHLVGNSAGGHLVGMAVAADWTGGDVVRSCTGMSGLYDLEPLVEATANDWLRLDADTARALSPVQHPPHPSIPMTLCVGGMESQAFKWQTNHYAGICRANGNPVEHFESPGKDHFEIIGELGTPGTPVFDRLLALIGRS